MIAVHFDRARALRWTWTAIAAAALLWYARDYRPRAAAQAAREAALRPRETRVQQARAAAVAMGSGGLDSLLASFRADSAELAVRVPADSLAVALATEIKAILGRRERDGDLRIVRSDPLPRTRENGFSVGGLEVTAVGRFAAVHALLSDLASHPRLIRVRNLRLVAQPDSLVASVRAVGAPAGGSAPADTLFTPAPGGAAIPPFAAVATFRVVWFTRPSAAPPAASTDSTSSPPQLP